MDIIIRDAEEKDIEDIYNLIRLYTGDGILLERDRDDIRNSLNTFLVAEADSQVRGIITHYDYGNTLKEVRTFAIAPEFQGMKIGEKLLKKLLLNIRKNSNAKIFVLTYKPAFFMKYGFKEVPKEEFPEKIWKDCAKCKVQDNCGETALVYLH